VPIGVPVLSAGGYTIAVLTSPFIQRLDEEFDQNIPKVPSIVRDNKFDEAIT
jgi:hypothetical protein